VVFAAAAAWLLSGLGTELLPPSDPRQFSVRIVGPPGQRVEATARVSAAVEEILREAAGDDLRAVLSEVGRVPEDDRFIRSEQTEENTARILIRLAAGGRSAKQIADLAAPVVAGLPNVEAQWEVGTSALARALGTTGPPVVVEISGQSLPDLRDGASKIATAFAESEALWNVRSSFEGGPPELRVILDRTMADGLGVDLDLVASSLQASLDGRKVTSIASGDEERDVSIRLPEVRRDQLLEVRLTTAAGVRLVVGDVASLVAVSGAREIFVAISAA
jgi:multidrug efflux pump